MARTHDYALALRWEGNLGEGTASYRNYGRGYRVSVAGKPDLVGSADPTFRGDRDRYNPEELLVAALSSCHMLSYLAHCARRGVRVEAYRDDARGRMVETPDGGGHFESVALAPQVAIAEGGDAELALALHEQAHADCFIARSCNFPVTHRASIAQVAPVVAPHREDLAIRLANRPGALAEVGEVLGRAGVSLEGGGGFVVASDAIVHFLVADAPRATAALREAGIDVIGAREVLVQRLDQGTPGQLGAFARALADAGVNIECVYSDHDNQLIVAVDDLEAGRRVAAAWR